MIRARVVILMQATKDELCVLGVTQDEINGAVRVLEAMTERKADGEPSKVLKRIRYNIDSLARPQRPKRKKRASRDQVALNSPQSTHIRCYVCKCKVEMKARHSHYQQMCCPCGKFNAAKREQTGDLRGRVAIVTGARVKIGFQVALKLLRAGAFVVATSRFVTDARVRYMREADYSEWAMRLLLVRLELGNRAAIEVFCAHMCARFEHIDVLINNAAQTIARPREFYRDVLAIEAEFDPSAPMEAGMLAPILCNETAASERLLTGVGPPLLTMNGDTHLFPMGAIDLANDRQQLDLRTENSWTQTLETAAVDELLQDLAINCAAPFILIQRLTSKMTKGAGDPPSAIVNVTAVEGMFNVHNKTAQHPSSNAAKAALNMITRTAGRAYWSKRRIAMNAVDTGLVTNEYPIGHRRYGHQTPLDEIDGAARILDPVFGLLGDPKHGAPDVQSGLLYKDYGEVDW